MVKVDFSSPNSRARRVIRLEKPSSDPEMPSAKVMAASLPESITRPRMRSSTRTRLFTARNIVEPPEVVPPRRHAFSDTVKVSSRFKRASANCSNTISATMTFEVEAGDIRSSAFLSYSTAPLSASIRIA